MRGLNTSGTTIQQRRPHRGGHNVRGAKKHGFSHPLMVELLEERLPLNSGPVANMNPTPAPVTNSVPVAAAPTATATHTSGSASGADAPPISASGTPAVLLFDPHQPAGLIPADVTSGSGPPLQQGAPPRFSYNLETNITGGDGAAYEVLTAPSHSGSTSPNGVPAAETIRGLPFDVNQEAATPAGLPRFSFGPQTAPRSPLENRDLPGLRPGTAPSPNNRTNPTQPSESAPGTQPILPPVSQDSLQSGTSASIVAAQTANPSETELTRIGPEVIAAGQPSALDVVAIELAAVMPFNLNSPLAGNWSGNSIEQGVTEQRSGPFADGELGDTNDQTPSIEGALISGALLTAARRPRQDSWPLNDVRRSFQLRSPERLSR